MLGNTHDSETPRPGAESEIKQNTNTETEGQGLSDNDRDYINRDAPQDFEDANRRPLDKMFGRPGEEMMNLNSAVLVSSRTLSRIGNVPPRQFQAHLTKLYEQQLDKVFAANEPTDEMRRMDRVIARGPNIDQKWETKKKVLKELLAAHVEQQWARVESNELRGEVLSKSYEAKILQDDHEKLKGLGVEHASLVEKAASAKDAPVEVTFYKGMNDRLGKAPEIRLSLSSKEKVNYGDPIFLGNRISEVNRQIEDAQREGGGFLGLGKAKKEQKIAGLERQKAELESQKQQAEKAEEQGKQNDRAIKEVYKTLKKINNYEFSQDNFKTDKLGEAKTLGQFIEALNAEIQRLGQMQPTAEQAAAQRLVNNAEQRVQVADKKIKELEGVIQERSYRDMRSDTLNQY